MTKLTVGGKTVYAAEYGSLDRARSARGSKEWIVQGDHDGERGVFWLVRPVDAAKLVAAGYEIVR
jgi:hypothetical protein